MTIKSLTQYLKQYFGFESFRPGQEEIIRRLLKGQDVLAVMPTGAGKSVCYQLPALLMKGVTLVISPLISLMKDQVDSLAENGIPAAYLNSSLTGPEFRAILRRAASGAYKLLYVAPERLETSGFQQAIEKISVSMIAVDEAHCVSQWGHDFRPSYAKIADLLQILPQRPVVAAFTATATQQVRQDISRLLDLSFPYLFTAGYDRKNLWFGVEKPPDKTAACLAFLREHPEQSGIIYCSTVKTVEMLGQKIQEAGFFAVTYHGNLSQAERMRNQELFLYDQAQIMVATNAFGMGIDKPDIRFVLHYNMPKNLESYYQEAGRAGRDQEPAQCVLYFGPSDTQTCRMLIEQIEGDHTIEYKKLSQMVDYCNTDRCLRETILQYFGEYLLDGRCQNCSNCCGEAVLTDITVESQKIMSCVKRMGERFGSNLVAAVLRGSQLTRIQELGFDRLSTFGIMREYSENSIKEMIAFLLAEGYLKAEGGKYPVLTLTAAAIPVLRGQQTVQTRRQLVKQEKEAEEDQELLAALRDLRRRLAAQQGLPPYRLLPDTSLKMISRCYPDCQDSLRQISGIGEYKLDRYGDAILEVVQAHIESHHIQDTNRSLPPKSKRQREKEEKIQSEPLDTRSISYHLFRAGRTPEEIARLRGLMPSTIEGHLLQCLMEGKEVNYSFVSKEDEKAIRAVVAHGAESLKSIKEVVDANVSYTAIRYVLYCMEQERQAYREMGKE